MKEGAGGGAIAIGVPALPPPPMNIIAEEQPKRRVRKEKDRRRERNAVKMHVYSLVSSDATVDLFLWKRAPVGAWINMFNDVLNKLGSGFYHAGECVLVCVCVGVCGCVCVCVCVDLERGRESVCESV
jgi:hypothetical protein